MKRKRYLNFAHIYGPPNGVAPALWRALGLEAANLAERGLVAVADNAAFSVGQFSEIGYDLSRNFVSARAHKLLGELATARQAAKFWSDMSAGQIVNQSENRGATHMAWRNPLIDLPERTRMDCLIDDLGPAGQNAGQITDVVNVGIGGSELGPALLDSVARATSRPARRFHSLSSVSAPAVAQVLDQLNPETTLVVLASKSFSTQETKLIADVLKAAYIKAGVTDWNRSFLAVTASPDKAKAWGVSGDRVFDMSESVGGRFSVGSPVSLAFGLTHGLPALQEFRQGLFVMDEAVAGNPHTSLALHHALIWYWYRVFFGLQSAAVVPYMQSWRGLTAYLQQLLMESLGKSHTVSGNPVTTPVGTVVIGDTGSNAQHSFMQFLQQGTTAVPVDLWAPLTTRSAAPYAQEFDDFQATNALAQSQALAYGNRGEIDTLGKPEPISARQAGGGRPSSVFLLPNDGLFSLGQVISFYEHSTVFQAALYDVNPFDQWGVEAGKSLARALDGRFPRVTLQVALEFLRNSIPGRLGS